MPTKYISYSFMKYIRPIWYFHLKPYDGKNTSTGVAKQTTVKWFKGEKND